VLGTAENSVTLLKLSKWRYKSEKIGYIIQNGKSGTGRNEKIGDIIKNVKTGARKSGIICDIRYCEAKFTRRGYSVSPVPNCYCEAWLVR
jgi:hypothetical protein